MDPVDSYDTVVALMKPAWTSSGSCHFHSNLESALADNTNLVFYLLSLPSMKKGSRIQT